jgi:hypothetical protein
MDTADGAATLVECPPGYCFHQFDEHGLRYSMHWFPENLADWQALQERALQLVAQLGGTAPQIGSPATQ